MGQIFGVLIFHSFFLYAQDFDFRNVCPGVNSRGDGYFELTIKDCPDSQLSKDYCGGGPIQRIGNMFRCDSGLRPIVEEALQRCGENLSADEYRACLQNGAGSNLEDLDDVREGGGSSGLGSNKGVKVPEPDGPPSTTADANQGDFESAAATFEMEADNIIAAGEQCRQTLDDTERCCAQPEKCIGEALGDSKGEVGSAAYKAFQIIGGFAGQFPASSIGAVCGRMKTVAVGFAAINSALSLKCSQKVRQCKSTCGSVAARARQQHEAYKSLPLKARQLYGGELLSKQTQLSQLAQAKDQCSRYDNAAVEKAFQAVSSAYASKMADMCKSQASTMPDPSQIARNQFDVDCSSPANAANPICQNQCARQGWENDPVCRAAAGLPPLGNNPGGLNAPQPAPNMPALADSTGLDEFEDRQNFEGAMAPAGQNKVNGGGTGGSGGLSMGGGGDFGGGGAGGGQGGDGGQGGYNTNVLAGNVRTGGGFSVPVMRGSAGGGYRGGAYNGARAPASTGKPFNPKDFLPGGRLDPKRKVAGLASAIPDIGAIHGDIFKNISVRFYEVCLRDGLYDCATLRKRGRPGN